MRLSFLLLVVLTACTSISSSRSGENLSVDRPNEGVQPQDALQELTQDASGQLCIGGNSTPCPNTHFCYYSALCSPTPRGVECGAARGDSRCHKLCSQDAECRQGEVCRDIGIFFGDVLDRKRFCVADEAPIPCTGDSASVCPAGFECYASRLCHETLAECLIEGDFTCHKRCQLDVDCPDTMPHCRPIFMWKNTTGLSLDLCTAS